MILSRLVPIALAAVLCLVGAHHAGAQPPAGNPPVAGARPQVPISVFLGLINSNEVASRAALKRIADGWRDDYTAPLLEVLGFVPVRDVQMEILVTLERVTGQRFGGDIDRWYQWVWSRQREDHPDYAEFKAALYEQVDPRFREYFGKQRPSIIRLDEIRWGGVWRDGIPPLKNPKMIPARQASYLADDNIVFGIAIDGDVRAYPRRILAWHEMFKDRIAGREMNGVYCTLCGSMILYEAKVGGVHYELGTSGFL